MTEIPATFRELARVNTGSHFLDSGGAYGRHWQQEGIPEDFPLEYVMGRAWPMVAISTAQLLENHLTIDRKATRHFRAWAHRADPDNDHGWLALAEAYCERMVATGRWEGEGRMTDNTYNWETDLDQDFQFTWPHGGEYALIQSHNGCDARGGYTAPIVACGDFEEVICAVQYRPYCRRCESDPETLYQAEKDGWRIRVNKHTASLVCGNCKRAAMRFPLVEGRG